MKKTILFTLLLSLVMCFSACDKTKKAEVKDAQVADSVMVVENVVNTDKQYMFTNYEKDWRWYETCIVLKDFLDEECDGTITGVSNIFQSVVKSGEGFDTQVVMITHVGDSTQTDIVKGFWVEDFPLQDENIKVTFKEAFEKVMAVNYPKPHSRQVVLRKEVGPNASNPQYIFGNQKAQLYVDAVTGEVTDKNPVFPEGTLQKPLGEWP